MELTSELKQRIISTVNHYTDKANVIYGTKISYPNVIFTKRGTTAGTANYASHTINFNPELYVRNVEAFLSDTAIHELSHLVAHQVYRLGRGIRITAHGEEWKRVMRKLGANPQRCHNYDVSETKIKRNTRTYAYHCNCRNHELSARKHNGILNGQSRFCRTCRATLKIGFLGAATSTPVMTKPVTPHPVVKKVVAPVYKVPAVGSKKDRAEQLYVNHKNVSRATMIAMFVNELDMTIAGASTYYANCKKMFG